MGCRQLCLRNSGAISGALDTTLRAVVASHAELRSVAFSTSRSDQTLSAVCPIDPTYNQNFKGKEVMTDSEVAEL